MLEISPCTRYRGLQVLFCLCYHLSELGIGGFFFSSEVEELLVIILGLLLVLEKIGIGIGNIIIGGDGSGVIGQMFLPRSNSLFVMLGQIIAFMAVVSGCINWVARARYPSPSS